MRRMAFTGACHRGLTASVSVSGFAPATQRGIALVMALVMLMILTILGLTAMSTSSLEEKMSGNIQE